VICGDLKDGERNGSDSGERPPERASFWYLPGGRCPLALGPEPDPARKNAGVKDYEGTVPVPANPAPVQIRLGLDDPSSTVKDPGLHGRDLPSTGG
jgi:hypothetical protein